MQAGKSEASPLLPPTIPSPTQVAGAAAGAEGGGGMNKSDPMLRDGKKMALSSLAASIPLFLFVLLVLTPIWIVILLPLAGISFAIGSLLSLCGVGGGGGDKKSSRPEQEEEQRSSEPPLTSASPRDLDIVVYGATGFTGRMAATYINKQYGSSSSSTLKWAIAGRRRGELEKIKAELEAAAAAAGNPNANIQVFVADASDVGALRAMARSAKVVVSTAGPFLLYGEQLVRVCAEEGTHYCDITGETDFVRKMIDKYDETAKASGACIVNMCGHDCVPWDLCVLELSKAMKKKGDTLASVACYDEILASASGGTMATVFHALFSGNRKIYKAKLGFDPLLKMRTGEKSDLAFKSRNAHMLGYSNEYKHWTGPFVMAAVMANCIKRSNALLAYSPKLLYSECQVYPNFFAGFVSVMLLLVFGTCLFVPPLRYLLLLLGVVPSPGQGPSEAAMDDGFLKVTAFGKGAQGSVAKTTFYFPTDPGYRDTARMAVECGLCLALQRDKVAAGGGILTPASCQGGLLIERLVASGSHFDIVE